MWGSAMAHGRLTPSCEKGLLSQPDPSPPRSAVFPSHPACDVRTGAEIFQASKESLFRATVAPPHTAPPKGGFGIVGNSSRNFLGNTDEQAFA